MFVMVVIVAVMVMIMGMAIVIMGMTVVVMVVTVGVGNPHFTGYRRRIRRLLEGRFRSQIDVPQRDPMLFCHSRAVCEFRRKRGRIPGSPGDLAADLPPRRRDFAEPSILRAAFDKRAANAEGLCFCKQDGLQLVTQRRRTQHTQDHA